MWAGIVFALCLLMNWAGEQDKQDCEVRLAKRLNTTAVYENGHCFLKGYGRADGR